MPHILFVCTANICRSPVATGVLRDRLQRKGMESWTVVSAGTWALHARPAASNSVLVLADQGIDISQHQARMVGKKLLAEADLVLCMEIGHVEALRAEFPQAAGKIYLLSEMVGKHYSIADPYGGSLAQYRHMADEITTIIDEGFERIVELACRHATEDNADSPS